ncbi:MAG: heme-binding protein [Sinobacterium sp.]|nr:heme-binding protein [Sinobacterium sp.]
MLKKTFLLLAMALPAVAMAGNLPSHSTLRSELKSVVGSDNGGFETQMWATIVDRDGVVTTVVFSGKERGDQWPGSRVISAQKANTANAFSLPDFALSSANLYTAVQPDGSLYGLQHSNPVDVSVAYGGESSNIGTEKDFMVGKKIGGINVFGGGLALYDEEGELLGALGVSGDTSCADHNIAWKLRHALNLDYVPAGVNEIRGKMHLTDDNIVYDNVDWAHAKCSDKAKEVSQRFFKTRPTRKFPGNHVRRKP